MSQQDDRHPLDDCPDCGRPMALELEVLDETDAAALKRHYPSTWASPDRPRTRRAADLYAEGVRQALLERGIDPETGRSLLEREGEAEDAEEAPDGR